MERVEIAPGLEFSRIVYGMWRLTDDADTSPAHVRAKIDACLEQGITTMDQADIYGGYMSEEVLGRAFAEDTALRDKVELVTKCDIVAPAGRHAGAPVKYYDTSYQHIEASLDASLRLMNVDHIDLLLIHRQDPLMDHEETGDALDRMVASGKTRFVGVSNFRPWDVELLQSAMTQPLIVNQIEVSLKCIAPFTNGDLAFHQRRGDTVMAWSPLGGGALMSETSPLTAVVDEVAADFGVDRAAVAVAFLLRHPIGMLPVMGTNTLARIRTIADAARVELDRPTWFRLYEAALGHEVP